MPKKNSVAIIIVNWNGLEHLKQCLPTLHKQTHKPLTVYVADNGSTDGSDVYMAEHFPWVKVVQNGKNLGFAEGNNAGIAAALADKHDYILLLNNDTTVPANAVSRLVDYMETHPRVGIAQPKLLLMNNPDRIDSCGSWFTRTGFLIHRGCEEKDEPKYNKPMPMFTIKGAAMIVRREVFESVGLLDPDFFAYFEETDLCWQAWLRGFKTYYAPVTTVYHKVGGSTKKIGTPMVNYHSFKNHIMSQIKNLAWYNLMYILPIHVFIVLGFSIVYLLVLKPKNTLAVYKALGWNITHLGANLKKRRRIQSTRVISDKELFTLTLHPVDWVYVADFATRFFKHQSKVDRIAAEKKRGERHAVNT